MPPKPIPPPSGKPLSTTSKQVQPPAPNPLPDVPTRVSVRPSWVRSKYKNPLPEEPAKKEWTRKVSQVQVVRRKSTGIVNQVAQAPPVTSPGAKLSSISEPIVLPSQGQGQGQPPDSIALSQDSGPPDFITLPDVKLSSVLEPIVLPSQGQGQGQPPDSIVLLQNSGPPESDTLPDVITEQPLSTSIDHSDSDSSRRRSFHVRRAKRASHYEPPSEKAWRDTQPPPVSPFEEPKYTDETIWAYKNWSILEFPPDDPRTDKVGYTSKERWSKLWRDCKICMCCIGHGPKKDNPCACLKLPITQGAYLANAFSIVMSISSIIFEFCRISFPHDESEIPMSAIHIFVCVMLITTSLLLFYGLDQFNIIFCFPWIIWQATLTALYFWVIPLHFMQLSKGPTRRGRSVHSFSVLFGVPALGFHIYILCVVSAFVYNVKFKKLGPDTPNPYRMDPDNFLHLPDFPDFD